LAEEVSAMRVCLWIVLGSCIAGLVGCSGTKEDEPSGSTEHGIGEDGRHHLADAPLKTFPESKSDQWRTEEAMEKAEQRAKAYKSQHNVQAQPTSPDPMMGAQFGLAEALAGIDGDGPVKAIFDTTEGKFECVLDTEGSALGAAHFIGLARGNRPWWDSAKARWSTSPLYTNIPVYRVVTGEAFFSGCPMSVGFAEVGFRTVLPEGQHVPPEEAYDLALVTPARVPSFGPQFMVTAKSSPKIDALAHVIGACEGVDAIQKIAGKRASKSGHPVDEVLVRQVTITR
jgi:peptidyl-prolyl cis-trans isomerase A (cyclophilin A)